MMFASPLFLLFARAARLEQFSPLGKVSQRHKRPSNDESTLSTGRENVEGDCLLAAEQFMKSQMGLLMNIVLGIVGAVIASWLFSMLGVSLGGGWLGYLIAGFIGACILIFAGRAIRRTT
jgi:uncharacterized membrane protein YeaQ/YmgE (transglycosylase-associated protein family)